MLAPMFNAIGGGNKVIPDLFVETDFVSADTDADADSIYLWEDGSYTRTYFFSSDAGDAWSSGDDGFEETEDTIPAGLGFWFFRRGSAMTIRLPVPYSL